MSSMPPSGALPPGAPGPSKASQAALWVVVILGSCFAFVIVAGLLLVRHFVHRVNISDAGNKVLIETPVGSINVNKNQGHATGLPVYPSATRDTKDGGSVEINGSETRLGLATETYQTSDSISVVKDWYRHKLGPEFRLETGHHKDDKDSHGSGVHVDVDSSDHDAAFVDDRGDGARVVALDEQPGGTKITLLRIGKRDTQ